MLSGLLSAALWLRTLLCFGLLGTLYIGLSLFVSPCRLQPMGKWACGVFLRAAGQKLRIEGEFPALENGPYMYLFNHASMLDTFIAIAVLPEFTGAIGKKEQFTIPIWGRILRHWGAVPIERGNLNFAIQSLNKGEAVLSDGRSLLIAPEGTRSPNGQLLPFKKGPFHMAANTQTPIVLLAITGAFEAKKKGDWQLRPGTITVQVLPTIDSKGRDMAALRQQSWDMLSAHISK